jgi:hypothetical protein
MGGENRSRGSGEIVHKLTINGHETEVSVEVIDGLGCHRAVCHTCKAELLYECHPNRDVNEVIEATLERELERHCSVPPVSNWEGVQLAPVDEVAWA